MEGMLAPEKGFKQKTSFFPLLLGFSTLQMYSPPLLKVEATNRNGDDTPRSLARSLPSFSTAANK